MNVTNDEFQPGFKRNFFPQDTMAKHPHAISGIFEKLVSVKRVAGSASIYCRHHLLPAAAAPEKKKNLESGHDVAVS